jgi:hypothetical protein
MLKSKPSSLYRVDEDEVAVGSGGGGTAPTEAQMKLFIAQTLSMNFAYNAPVVVLKFDVAENGNITGLFKDAARPRMFSFTLDGESVTYKPYKPGKMDSLESDEDVQEWEAFSEGYGFRVDAGVGGKKKPQCVKPTAYNCGSACINVMKDCKTNAKDAVSKDRLKKLKGVAMSYYKEFEKLDKTERGSDKQKGFGDKANQASRKRLELMEQSKSKKGVKSDEPQIKPKAESKKPSSQKSSTQKTVEPEVKTKPNVEPKKTESKPKSKANPFYSDEPIKDYETFKKEIPKELARLDFEYNHGGVIPISQVREDLKGRVNEKDFDEWMKQSMYDDDKDTIRLISSNPENRPDPKGIKSPMGGVYDHISFRDEEAAKKAKTEIKRKPGQITDQKEFEKIANEAFDKISKAKGGEDLIEIYKIRQELGDKVSRGDFNNLFKKMTEWGGDFQAVGGSLSTLAENDIGIKDSIPDELNGHGTVKTYVKRSKE